jgi:hypothetical protein
MKKELSFKERLFDGTNPFFNPEYNKYKESILTNFICPTMYLFSWILLIIGLIVCLIPSVDGSVTFNSSLNITEITDSSISWHYDYLTANRPQGATLDGVIISDFKTDYVYNYTATGLKPKTTHEFCIFGAVTSNCLSGTTLENSGDNIVNFFWEYLFIFIAILLTLGAIKIPLCGIVAEIFALTGMLSALPKGNFYLDLMFVAVVCGAGLITYIGVRK